MKEIVFESKMLDDGHLYCPKEIKEIAEMKNAQFKVIATFADNEAEASERELEAAAVHDLSEDYLSEKEVNYYLNLKEV